jgi:hypothetical protein
MVLDASSASGRSVAALHTRLNGQPAQVTLLWVITPSETLSWTALAAESAKDHAHAVFVYLAEQMARARHGLAPVERALHRLGIHAQTCVVHGAAVEAVAQVVDNEQISLTLIGARPPGVRQRDLADAVAQRTGCTAEVLA